MLGLLRSKTLQEVPAGQILAHRIAWSLLFVGLVLTARHNWGWLHGALRRPRIVLTFLLSGILLGHQLVHLYLGVKRGFHRRDQPGLFHQSAGQRAARLSDPQGKLRATQWLALSVALAGVLI